MGRGLTSFTFHCNAMLQTFKLQSVLACFLPFIASCTAQQRSTYKRQPFGVNIRGCWTNIIYKSVLRQELLTSTISNQDVSVFTHHSTLSSPTCNKEATQLSLVILALDGFPYSKYFITKSVNIFCQIYFMVLMPFLHVSYKFQIEYQISLL